MFALPSTNIAAIRSCARLSKTRGQQRRMTILEFGSEKISLEEVASEASSIVAAAIDRLIKDYKQQYDDDEREEEPALT
jgi:hypothetical protein